MKQDWATQIAFLIISTAERYAPDVALELIASELRLAYAKGERAGVASALEGARGEKREGVAA